MGNSLIVSQEVSMLASQLEIDPAAKAQKASQLAQNATAGVFLKLLETSMEMVNELAELEQEDPLRDEEEDLNED